MSDSWLRDLRFAARVRSGASPAFFARRGGDARPGHRRRHRDLFGRLRRVAAPAALSAGRTAGPDLRSQSRNGKPREDVSKGTFHDWREGAPSLESAALYTKPRTRFLEGADRDPIISMGVSPAFFDVLGARPALGRGFKPERRIHADDAREVVLTHAAWRRLFNGDPAAVGRFIRFADDDDPFEVVGVLPASFSFTQPVDIFQPRIVEVPVARILRNWRYDRMIARLRPGATIEQARAELGAVSARLGRDFPTINEGWSATIEPLRDSIVGIVCAGDLAAAGGGRRRAACRLPERRRTAGGARRVARPRDAVRIALGAGSWRLLRLWLAEALDPRLPAGALGIVDRVDRCRGAEGRGPSGHSPAGRDRARPSRARRRLGGDVFASCSLPWRRCVSRRSGTARCASAGRARATRRRGSRRGRRCSSRSARARRRSSCWR